MARRRAIQLSQSSPEDENPLYMCANMRLKRSALSAEKWSLSCNQACARRDSCCYAGDTDDCDITVIYRRVGVLRVHYSSRKPPPRSNRPPLPGIVSRAFSPYLQVFF